jgi:hypothetical protein
MSESQIPIFRKYAVYVQYTRKGYYTHILKICSVCTIYKKRVIYIYKF